MLSFHKTHFLFELIAHHTCQQVWICETHLLCLGYGFFIYYVLYGELFEELAHTFVFGCRLDVVLLKGVLIWKFLGLSVLLIRFVLLLPVCLLLHHVFLVLFGVPSTVLVNQSWLRYFSLLSLIHFFSAQRVNDSWNSLIGWILNHF